MTITSRPPPGPVLLALREGTQACHKSLEARLPFFSEGFDHDAYRRLIEAYYGFHAPLEALLATHQGSERNKAEALCRDLQALKLSAEQIDALPLCRDLPAITDEASALGVMYVLEGSTLGGQVLRRAMAQRLGIDADSGGGFLDVYGSATASHWRGFIERLDRHPLSPENQARTVAAAVATFTCFERWLEQRAVLLHAVDR